MVFPQDKPELDDIAAKVEADPSNPTSLRSKLVDVWAELRANWTGLLDKVGVDNSSDPASLDFKVSRVVENVYTASHVLALADAGTVVAMNVDAPNTITIPLNSSVAFPIGTVIEGYTRGTGQTTTVAAAGVTLEASGSRLKSAARYATWGYRKRDTDIWVVSGDLVA